MALLPFLPQMRRLVVPNPTILHRNLPIIEVAESLLLDELMLDRYVSDMVLARLSDRVALIDPARYDALVARLRKLGHLPKAEA
jgi:hypothetical protein